MGGVEKSGNKFVCFFFPMSKDILSTFCVYYKLFEVNNLLNFCLVRDFTIVYKYFLDSFPV